MKGLEPSLAVVEEHNAPPPVIPPSESELAVESSPASPLVGKARWFVHLILFGSYPLLIGLLPWILEALAGVFDFKLPQPEEGAEAQPALSTNPVVLLVEVAIQLVIFFALFGVCWLFSRATKDQLLLAWNNGSTPVWRGFLYSIGLRVGVGILVVGPLVVFMLAGAIDENAINDVRPKVEHTVDTRAVSDNPVYFFLNLTVVSFLLAGFREEFWRVGVLAAIAVLFPRMYSTVPGKLFSIFLVAVIFGLGHLSQGWGGVVMTTLLGMGLGAIMVFHRSLWDAVLAHGFFNASTFVFLYIIYKVKPDFNFNF